MLEQPRQQVFPPSCMLNITPRKIDRLQLLFQNGKLDVARRRNWEVQRAEGRTTSFVKTSVSCTTYRGIVVILGLYKISSPI